MKKLLLVLLFYISVFGVFTTGFLVIWFYSDLLLKIFITFFSLGLASLFCLVLIS